MNNASPSSVARASMDCVDRLQNHDTSIQSVAAAVLFIEVCKAHRVDAKDVMTVANNMLADTIQGEREEFRALRLYCKHELSDA